MNTEPPSPRLCPKCGRPVEPGRIFCAQCTIERAEEHIPDRIEPLSSRPVRLRTRKGIVTRLMILLFCLAVMALQIPGLFAAFQAEKPLRLGTYETDAKTDQCIANLWHLARLLQDNRRPDGEIVCPSSGRPYIITRVGDDILARCPNPGAHGFSEISVTKGSPLPEVKP
jgi:hypothetical protein